MLYYANHSIWFNELRNEWMLQAGYELIGSYRLLSTAKRIATLRNKETKP